jgi:hypothetical protein
LKVVADAIFQLGSGLLQAPKRTEADVRNILNCIQEFAKLDSIFYEQTLNDLRGLSVFQTEDNLKVTAQVLGRRRAELGRRILELLIAGNGYYLADFDWNVNVSNANENELIKLKFITFLC